MNAKHSQMFTFVSRLALVNNTSLIKDSDEQRIMEALKSPFKPGARPRSRKSIAHFPSAALVGNQENQTDIIADAPALMSPSKKGTKRARSKSIGPGGLDALRNDSGNRQKVCNIPCLMNIS